MTASALGFGAEQEVAPVGTAERHAPTRRRAAHTDNDPHVTTTLTCRRLRTAALDTVGSVSDSSGRDVPGALRHMGLVKHEENSANFSSAYNVVGPKSKAAKIAAGWWEEKGVGMVSRLLG